LPDGTVTIASLLDSQSILWIMRDWLEQSEIATLPVFEKSVSSRAKDAWALPDWVWFELARR
jgi:hypothetical protein